VVLVCFAGSACTIDAEFGPRQMPVGQEVKPIVADEATTTMVAGTMEEASVQAAEGEQAQRARLVLKTAAGERVLFEAIGTNGPSSVANFTRLEDAVSRASRQVGPVQVNVQLRCPTPNTSHARNLGGVDHVYQLGAASVHQFFDSVSLLEKSADWTPEASQADCSLDAMLIQLCPSRMHEAWYVLGSPES
jgi:hypothetical protein